MSVVVITGASRKEGIGFEVARQLATRGMTVVLTARDPRAAEQRASELRAEGLDVSGGTLDVADDASVTAFAAKLQRVDVLVNNAARMSTFGEQPSTADHAKAREAMETTLFGAWRVTRALLPQLTRSAHGRIVNVSSGAGSHGDTAFGLSRGNAMGPGYAVPKAALNALTVLFANELRASKILVNAVCPGFTATFPGGKQMGARPVRDGAASVVWACTLPQGGPTGGFFRDGQPLPW